MLEPGQACAFPVEIAPVSGNLKAKTFGDGRLVITGSGRDRVTNLDTSASEILHSSGKLTTTQLSDGDVRIQGSGRTVIFLFDGDQGPFGEVAFPGALYLMVGHVDEILDLDTNVITSFEWGGQAIELCGLID